MKCQSIALFIVFLIVSSNAFDLSRKRRVSSRSGRTKVCTLRETIDVQGWDIFSMVYAFYSTASSSFVDSVVDDIKTVLKVDDWIVKKIGQKSCSDVVKEKFNAEIEASVNKEQARATTEYGALSDAIKAEGLTLDQQNTIKSQAATPRAQCESTVAFAKVKTESTKDNKYRALQIQAQLDKELGRETAKAGTVTQVYLNGKKNDWTNVFAKRMVADYAAENCKDATQVNFIKCLTTYRGYVNESTLADDKTLSALNDAPAPKCKYFPTALGEDIKCKQAGLLLKGRALLAILKDADVKTCVGLVSLSGAISTVVGKVVTKGVDLIVTKIFNILGSFWYAGVKIIYFTAKMFYHFYKLGELAAKQNPTVEDMKAKSEALGNSLGFFFRIVYSVVEMAGAKKRKVLRLQRFNKKMQMLMRRNK